MNDELEQILFSFILINGLDINSKPILLGILIFSSFQPSGSIMADIIWFWVLISILDIISFSVEYIISGLSSRNNIISSVFSWIRKATFYKISS